jgi:hypothetical protein
VGPGDKAGRFRNGHRRGDARFFDRLQTPARAPRRRAIRKRKAALAERCVEQLPDSRRRRNGSAFRIAAAVGVEGGVGHQRVGGEERPQLRVVVAGLVVQQPGGVLLLAGKGVVGAERAAAAFGAKGKVAAGSLGGEPPRLQYMAAHLVTVQEGKGPAAHAHRQPAAAQEVGLGNHAPLHLHLGEGLLADCAAAPAGLGW